MKRVLCLYRVSTKKQLDPNYTDISNADIPLQEIACRTYIANRPEWTLYDEKYERGVSGFKVSAAQRDVILDIQAEAVKKAFDVLLVYLSDRIGRKENETPFLVEWFVQNGIEVWTVQEGQLRVETHVDKLVNYIRFWEANGESLKTSIRVSDRQKQLVEDGIWRGGACPYGYNLVFNGRIGKKNRQLLDLVIEPAEAAIVREIFSLLCYEGWGSYRIANHLNSKYPNPDKVWTPRTVISLIRNPIYIGRMRFNDTITIKPIEHLRIIDDSLFEFAERALKEHIPKKYALSKSKSNGFVDVSRLSSQDSQEVLETLDLGVTKARVYGASLLSGILYCAHCDHKLVGTYHSKFNSRGERVYRPVYRCYNGAVKAKNCDGQRTYSAAKVEGAVLTTVRQYFSTFSRAIDELWRTQTTAELQRKSGFVLHNAQTELNKIMQRQMKLN